MDETDELESDLRNAIAMDYRVYVLADDEYRHFEPLDAAAAYASYLFFLFLCAAAERVRKRLESEAKKAGVAAADKLINLALSFVGLKPERVPTEKRRMGLQQARVAAMTLKGDWDEESAAAGEQAVAKRLVKDRFPEGLAKEKAATIGKIIRRRVLQ